MQTIEYPKFGISEYPHIRIQCAFFLQICKYLVYAQMCMNRNGYMRLQKEIRMATHVQKYNINWNWYVLAQILWNASVISFDWSQYSLIEIVSKQIDQFNTYDHQGWLRVIWQLSFSLPHGSFFCNEHSMINDNDSSCHTVVFLPVWFSFSSLHGFHWVVTWICRNW